MKKTYLIIAGVMAVLLLIVIWIYLLIYGTPKPVEQFFTDFSISDTTNNIPLEPFIPIETEAQIDTTTEKLRQLTTRPIIGMGEYTKDNFAEGPISIRYAEAGTGHIFSINLTTGEETRISNTTITGASRAVFSPNGQYVAITAGYTNQSAVTLVTIGVDNESTKNILLPQKISDFTFSQINELRYTENSSSGQTGKSLNPETLVTRTIFTVPFQSATIVWSKNSDTSNYVYPKTSSKLPGYLYQLEANSVQRLEISGLGLSALVNSEYVVSTKLTNNTPVSRALNLVTGKSVALPIIAEPSKCQLSILDNQIMYCGNDTIEYGSEFPDDWYKGTRSFNDRLFKVDLKRGSATQLISPETVLGRQIDVYHMNLSVDNKMLYFMNKNDNTLWMYEF